MLLHGAGMGGVINFLLGCSSELEFILGLHVIFFAFVFGGNTNKNIFYIFNKPCSEKLAASDLSLDLTHL